MGRRLSYARAETVLADDPRRPILLLRAFDDDAIILYEDWSQSRRSDSTSLEDAITGPAKLLGPVIAIGRPEEPIRYRGAARQYHSEAEWQQAVLAWMDRALLIVVIAGRTAGLSWELGELDNRGLLHKVVVFFPPEGEGKRHHRWSALWQSLTSVSRAAITQAGSVRGMVALHFRPSGSMVVLRSRRRARSGHYTAALNLAIYGCLCHDWKEANGPSGVAGDPADRDAYISSGNTHIAMREYQRAIADYTKAIELNPDEADAYCSRGIAYSHEQDFDRTIADQTKAIEINPRSARAYSNRGFAHFSKGESDRSIADCTKAIEIDPRYPDGYIIRSAAYFRTREYDRALQDCTTALELDPNSAMAFFNRAAAWEKKGDAAHAIADYRRALAIDPSDTRAQAALARLDVRP